MVYHGKLYSYHGTPWYTMVTTMVYHGNKQLYHGVPWCTMVHHGETMVYHGITMVYYGNTMVFLVGAGKLGRPIDGNRQWTESALITGPADRRRLRAIDGKPANIRTSEFFFPGCSSYGTQGCTISLPPVSKGLLIGTVPPT